MDDSTQILCDCGHPVSYHQSVGGEVRCGWCPPHSEIRCRCHGVTTTGIPREERYNLSDPDWKPWDPRA